MWEKIFFIVKPPDPNYHYNKNYMRNMVEEQDELNDIILDIGSGGRKLARNAISLDIQKIVKKIDVIADAAALPFKDGCFNLIISTAVLEHVVDADTAVKEIYRCCSMNGQIYIEVPFLQTYHAHPNDFRRFTLTGLEKSFSCFTKVNSGVCVGPFSVLAWYCRKLPRFIFNDGRIGFVSEFFAAWLTFWIKYFDAIIPGARRAHQVASGLFFHGVKAAK